MNEHERELFEELRQTMEESTFRRFERSSEFFQYTHSERNNPAEPADVIRVPPLADIFSDWGRHCNESSGRLFFNRLIEDLTKSFSKRGLLVTIQTQTTEECVMVLCYDTIGSKDHYFKITNIDNKNYSWEKFPKSWRDY